MGRSTNNCLEEYVDQRLFHYFVYIYFYSFFTIMSDTILPELLDSNNFIFSSDHFITRTLGYAFAPL